MDLVREFFSNKSGPRLLLIAALLLLFLSQFWPYLDDAGSGFLSIDSDWNTTGYYILGAYGTGWDLHPHAYLILLVLAFALLRDDIAEHRLFVRWGYWACLALIFAATVPGAPLRATGAAMGSIAFLVALCATAWHALSGKRVSRPSV